MSAVPVKQGYIAVGAYPCGGNMSHFYNVTSNEVRPVRHYAHIAHDIAVYPGFATQSCNKPTHGDLAWRGVGASTSDASQQGREGTRTQRRILPQSTGVQACRPITWALGSAARPLTCEADLPAVSRAQLLCLGPRDSNSEGGLLGHGERRAQQPYRLHQS